MTARHVFLFTFLTLSCAGSALAQDAPKEPPPLWDLQVGASFVGTSGNSDTASTGADFAAHRRGEVWKLESTATAVHTSDKGDTTAERYLAAIRADRTLTPIIGLSMGEKVEKDRFAGIDFRNIADVGLSWALVHHKTWTLDGVTGIAWNHESRTVSDNVDDPVGLFQLLSRIPFGASGDTTQRVTFYPDFRNSSAYRTEFELTAQAAMNAHLALKIGYLLRYSNDPVPGFQKTDNTTTASVVFRWKASTPAPKP
jgi:putative salt-induced outer membrane protein